MVTLLDRLSVCANLVGFFLNDSFEQFTPLITLVNRDTWLSFLNHSLNRLVQITDSFDSIH